MADHYLRVASIGLLATQDYRLALPMRAGSLYAMIFVVALPRIRARSRDTTDARSAITGKVVDSFTNILTVKLFGRRAPTKMPISARASRDSTSPSWFSSG